MVNHTAALDAAKPNADVFVAVWDVTDSLDAYAVVPTPGGYLRHLSEAPTRVASLAQRAVGDLYPPSSTARFSHRGRITVEQRAAWGGPSFSPGDNMVSL
jgi:hypothetical protein